MAAQPIELCYKVNEAQENHSREQKQSVRRLSSVREQTSSLLGFALALRSRLIRTHPSVYRPLEGFAVISARLLACS